MKQFEVPIYLDALGILNQKVDIRAEVEEQLRQGDPALENIIEEIMDEACEDGLEPIEGIDPDSIPIDMLMAYVLPIDENKIEFDYSETYEANDRRLVVFRIPCEFDDDRFIHDNYTERTHEIED